MTGPRRPAAILLAAHGSRHDNSVAELLRAQAAAVLARGRVAVVRVGQLHGTPQVEEALASLAGHDVTVVPFFASGGYFADQVLPRRLESAGVPPEASVRLAAPVGEHPAFVEVVERRARSLLQVHAWAPRETAIVVVGHGTARAPQGRQQAERVAAGLASLGASRVLCAFLDEAPGLEDVLAELPETRLLVLPLLVGGAGHAQEDVPAALGLGVRGPRAAPVHARVNGREVVLDVPMGQWLELAALIDDAARRAAVGWGSGSVHLVGAGPGDPSLITVRGLDLLRQADVLLYDRLVAPQLVAEAPPHCVRIDVGKRPGGPRDQQQAIEAQLVAHASAGRRVVRLKGGDPFVFGRGGEELMACRAAGIPCEVVSGVSSAIAGPAAAGVPVTLRGVSRSFAVLTAFEAGESPGAADLSAVAGVDTLVLLMSRASLRRAAEQLLAAGRAAELPALCVSRATLPEQRVVRATLGTIAAAVDAAALEAPMVTVIGAVAAALEAPGLWEACAASYRSATPAA